jgi:hypothetical protein
MTSRTTPTPGQAAGIHLAAPADGLTKEGRHVGGEAR